MVYVIACGDEGVQINEGTRLAFVGAGIKLERFSEVIPVLQSLFGADLRIAASEENDWTREQFQLSTYEQADATMQQYAEVSADKHGLLYSGCIPFADPQQLAHDIKAHMVRPHGIHIANKICFTLGGGEQTYNLGCYLISADWVSQAPEDLVVSVIRPQIDFYKKLAKREDLEFVFELGGELGEDVAVQNKKTLEKMGLV